MSEATVQLQIEAAGKILSSVTFGPKSVENSSEHDNFFELTTPNDHAAFTLQSYEDYLMIPSFHS